MTPNRQYVEVYWNLHRQCFSVRHKGKVVAHTQKVYLENPSFRVSQSGRDRVLREQRKNVHARVCGTWVADMPPVQSVRSCTYNPYRYNTFVTQLDHQPIYYADACILTSKKIKAVSFIPSYE